MTITRQSKQIRYRGPTINDIKELFQIEKDCFKSYYQGATSEGRTFKIHLC